MKLRECGKLVADDCVFMIAWEFWAFIQERNGRGVTHRPSLTHSLPSGGVPQGCTVLVKLARSKLCLSQKLICQSFPVIMRHNPLLQNFALFSVCTHCSLLSSTYTFEVKVTIGYYQPPKFPRPKGTWGLPSKCPT